MFISEFLPAATHSNPNGIALQCRDEVVTYREMHDRVSRLASALRRLGIHAGERIALLGHPCIPFVIAEHAAVAVGAIPIAVFPSLAPVEMEAILADASPSAIVFDAAHVDVLDRRPSTGRPLEISCARDGRRGVELDELIRLNPAEEPWHRPAPTDIALIIYTGGTTRRPKGVMHTHCGLSTWFGFNASAGHASSKSILFNLAHASGQMTLWSTLAARGCLTLLPRYPPTAADVVDLIERDRITVLGTVSGMLRAMLQMPDIEQRDLRSVTSIFVGGAFTNSDTLVRTSQLFPSSLVFNSYALTESGTTISMLPVNLALRSPRRERMTSVGFPEVMRLFRQTPFAVRIVDADGHDQPRAATGEILVRGEQQMAGYWNNADATRHALQDGWLRTGDIGRIDDDGYLYLAGRQKDMIIVANGVCVYSAEVEAVLERHPVISDVGVVSTSSSDGAERVTAVAVLCPGQRLNLEGLQEFCVNKIASFKIPTQLVIVDSLPWTRAGKVDKAALQAFCAARARTSPAVEIKY
jgi:acyl-CoA synthetase (AMP-forming)/AMP-acid ligase II